MLCSYGCGQEANYFIGKKQKPCCKKHYSTCPEFIRVAVEGRKKAALKRKENNIPRKMGYCIYCGIKITLLGKVNHQNHCPLNPNKIKFCPICDGYIKYYHNNKTCSHQCANETFKQGEGHIPLNKGEYSQTNYRKIAKKYHIMKCIICNENIMIDIHHFDRNRDNNEPENLVPICATHHRYIHHNENYYIVKECIDEYVEKFKNKGNQ